MSPELIPALDPTPIPAPEGLFHGLLVLTFFLHVLFLDLTLGGTLLAAVARLRSGGRPGDPRTVLAGRLVSINTYGISLTITTGVAPLLFVQVLYQQFFYTATILIAAVWLGLLVLLMVGYYAVYVYKFRGAPVPGAAGTAWLGLAAVLFVAIAMIQVAVNLIHAQPGGWAALAEHPWSILADPTYLPRLLHFLLGAVAVSALVVAWWAVRRARTGGDAATERPIARFAWRWALGATALQVVDGFLLLMLLPGPVLTAVAGGGAATLLPLGLAVLLGVGLLVMLARVDDPTGSPALVTGALAVVGLTVALMAVTRHQVRFFYLEPATSTQVPEVAAQWGNFALFALLLVVALAVVGAMVRLVVVHRREGEEAA